MTIGVTDTREHTVSLDRPWPPKVLTRATWLQHRATLVSLLVLFLASAITFALSEPSVHSIYARFLADGCTGLPHEPLGCGNYANAVASDTNSFTAFVIVLRVLPVVTGLFVGAPLLARDLESGTYRFTWTQGAGRIRYVFSSFAVLAVVVVLIAVVLGLLVGGWYLHGINVMNPNDQNHWQSGLFNSTWFMLSAWTLFALSLGTLIGAAVKRVVASMLVTALLLSGLTVVSSLFLTRALRVGALVTSRIPIQGVNAGTLNVTRQGHPSTWLLRGWVTGPHGAALGNDATNRLERVALATKNPEQWLTLHHYTFWVSYQTANRFWIYQGVGGALLVACAVVFVLLTWRVVRAGRA